MIGFVLLIVVPAIVGILIARRIWREHHAKVAPAASPRQGWVGFIAGEDGPVLVTAGPAEPKAGEATASSPVQLRVLLKFRTPDYSASWRQVLEQIGQDRVRGNWFERDAALAFADYLKRGDA